MANVLIKIAGDITELDRATKQAVAKIRGMATQMESVGRAMTASLTLPIVGLGVASLKAFGEIDSLKKALKSLEGSVEGAERRFRELQEVAKLPGLGIREAVQADLTLRNFGRSASQAKTEVMAFGNALAAAGRGKADLSETIRQFGQLTSAAKLTQENLTPIIERVPQVAAILRAAFGPTGGTAEGLRNLGVTTAQASAAIITGLQKIPPVASGFKNAMENLSESVVIALVEIGDGLEPTATRIADEFITPTIAKVKDLAKEFQSLPPATQNAILGVTAFVAIAGPTVYALGLMANAMLSIKAAAAFLPAAFGAAKLAGLTMLAAVERVAIGMGLMSASVTVATSVLASLGLVLAGGAIAAGLGYLAFRIWDVISAEKAMSGAQKDLGVDLDFLEKKLRAQGVEVDALKGKYRLAIDAMREAASGGRALDPASMEMIKNYRKELTALAKDNAAIPNTADPAAAALAGVGAKAHEAHEKVHPLDFATRSLTNRMIMLRDEANKHDYATAIKGLDTLQRFMKLNSERALDWHEAFSFAGDGWRTGAKLAENLSSELEVSHGLWKILPAPINDVAKSLESIADSMAAEALANISAAMKQFEADAKRAREDNARIAKVGVEIAKQGQRDLDAEIKKSAGSTKKAMEEMRRHVQRHVHDLSRDLAKLIFEGGKFGEVMVASFRKIGQAIVAAAIEKQLGRIVGYLTDIVAGSGLAGKAIGAVFGVGASAAGSAVGATPPFVAGGGGVAGAAGQARGAINAAGGQANAAASQGASQGASGPIGAAAGVVSAASSVVANFQFAHMNTALGRIEESTRYVKAYSLQLVQEAMLWWPKINDVHSRLKQMVDTGIGVYSQPGDQGLRIAGQSLSGGGPSIIINNPVFHGSTARDLADEMMELVMDRMRAGYGV